MLQKERAAALRSRMTEAEVCLWQRVRMRPLNGLKFSRQIAIGPFIADFVCREHMLVIEVDGGQHDEDRDATRQHQMEARGYRVLRFWNHEVLGNTNGVLMSIAAALHERPPPTPPVPGGEQQRSSARR